MPHDFRSQDLRSGRSAVQPIGFHELRQACEISALREELERVAHEAGTLRDGIEDAVEQVRARFAALSADEMTDAAVMAPLLQFAVATLLDLRDRARGLKIETGALADDDRPSWMAADASRMHPNASPAAEPEAEQPAPPPPPSPSFSASPEPRNPEPQNLDPLPPRPPLPAAQRPVAPRTPPAASWLNPAAATPPPPPPPAPPAPVRSAPARIGTPSGPSKGIDWLGPAGR